MRAVADLDILNRDIHLLILSPIYILTQKKKFYIIIFFFWELGVSIDTPSFQVDPPMYERSTDIDFNT